MFFYQSKGRGAPPEHADPAKRSLAGAMLPDVDFSRGRLRWSGDATWALLVGETPALAYSNNENPPSIPDDSSGMRGFARAA
jgi:hypothetical protein